MDVDVIRVRVFNTWYNAAGNYQYTGWDKTTGDLRGGCNGGYFYCVIVTFNKQWYYIGP